MGTTKLAAWIRIALLGCSFALFLVLILPIWKIQLDAPQYPEGLELKIYAGKLGGNIEIINGLNHYIGMKTLHANDFIEFTVLPYIIGFFATAFLFVSVINKRKWLTILFTVFVLFGMIAMIDFWRWEYNYGHNLDPNAAIVVPGMAYQPPLIGFKQLLNFGAYSIPDLGGWIFIGVGLISMIAVYASYKQNKKRRKSNLMQSTTIIFYIIALISCNNVPEPIKAGKDFCYFCKMTISDLKFANELITKKGKVYKFDDIDCLLNFSKRATKQSPDIDKIYFSDFLQPNSFIIAENAVLLKCESFHSPMNGNIAAFSSRQNAEKISSQYRASVVNWEELYK